MLSFRSISDMDMLIREHVAVIPKVDCVVGIPRSGMLPATLIALYMGKPLLTLEQLWHTTTHNYSSRIMLNNNIRSVLIVDDSCDSGNALSKVKASLHSMGNFIGSLDITYGAVYVTERGKKHVDFYLEQVEQPRVFEWNILDHNIIQRACVDIDGVLCVNPTKEENDDGKKYLEFISTAMPLFIPHYPIHSIVSCRLEKYRPQTEEWLKDHHVQYHNLFMMDVADAETRRKIGGYGEFKAKIYKEQENTELFIESEPFQAELINVISHKPVYCVSTNTFYQ